MKIFFIHGRAQELFDEETLLENWTTAWDRGLEKANLTRPKNVTIELPYYGKLLKSLTDEILAPVDTQEKRQRSLANDYKEKNHIAFSEDYLSEIAKHLADTTEETQYIKEITKKERGGVLSWEITHSLLKLVERKQSWGEAAIRKHTTDVFFYLTVPEFKHKIHQVITPAIPTNEPCVVVGHSLGSIISYEILRDVPNLNVKKFITLGSPLGSRTIGKLLGGKRMPDSIQNGDWFNAYDERDVVALNPLDSTYFNVRPPIKNKNNVRNHTSNHHGIDGYLDDEVVAKSLYDAIFP